MFSFHYLNDAPIISVEDHPECNGNANGPALIRAPGWLHKPPGKYLLYFAHHEGRSIRLAASNNLTGPWLIISPAPLDLEHSLFVTDCPGESQLHPEARAFIEAGADGYYPHIASPDIWVDHDNRQIRLYYHGRMEDGLQRSRVALSRDGLNFETRGEILGRPYLRLFFHDGWFYALAMPAQLSRSRDGLRHFESGPRLTDEPIRHHALLRYDGQWFVFWTRVGDTPERILVSTLDTTSNWLDWQLSATHEVHRAQTSWEGADIETEPSQYGTIMHRANQLRDPVIYQEAGKIYLLYAIAGEQGIAVGELKANF